MLTDHLGISSDITTVSDGLEVSVEPAEELATYKMSGKRERINCKLSIEISISQIPKQMVDSER